jgi:hypothetical protein
MDCYYYDCFGLKLEISKNLHLTWQLLLSCDDDLDLNSKFCLDCINDKLLSDDYFLLNFGALKLFKALRMSKNNRDRSHLEQLALNNLSFLEFGY